MSSEIGKNHMLWANLYHLPNHFNDDLSQIRALLEETQPVLPFNYNENIETQLAPMFESLLASAQHLGDNDLVDTTAHGGTEPLRKGMLVRALDGVKRMAIKNQRNRNFLHIMSLNYLVSMFDATMEQIVLIVLREYPELELQQAAATLPAADVEEKIKRRIKRFGRGSVAEQLKYISELTGGAFNTEIQKRSAEFGQLVEIRETRNSHVHRQGLKNEDYRRKIDEFYKWMEDDGIGTFSPEAITYHQRYRPDGTYLEITEQYLQQAMWLCTSLLNAVIKALVEAVIPPAELQQIIDDNRRHWDERRGEGPTSAEPATQG